ncbi:hypothetical protein Trydic_g977 [Trypoxylus dichotomus]
MNSKKRSVAKEVRRQKKYAYRWMYTYGRITVGSELFLSFWKLGDKMTSTLIKFDATERSINFFQLVVKLRRTKPSTTTAAKYYVMCDRKWTTDLSFGPRRCDFKWTGSDTSGNEMRLDRYMFVKGNLQAYHLDRTEHIKDFITLAWSPPAMELIFFRYK